MAVEVKVVEDVVLVVVENLEHLVKVMMLSIKCKFSIKYNSIKI
jgi:hypothetical protein